MWIIKTGLAVKQAVSEKRTILTSVGMNSWEIALFFASRYRANIRMYIPIMTKANRAKVADDYIKQFNLQDKNIQWQFFEYDDLKRNRALFQSERDKAIIKQADIICPVSLRPNSNLVNLIKIFGKTDSVHEDYSVKYLSSSRREQMDYDSSKINPNMDDRLSDYVVHWTRGSNLPWPGENRYSYYDDIVKSNTYYPRNALQTLRRILSEKKLRASSRHYRKNCAAVAFSSLFPSEALHLMKWRARYREMSFEPYGIALKMTTAERFGIRRVLYGNVEMYQYLESEDRPYFQAIGRKGFWIPEREYRHIGDFDLSQIEDRDMTIIVRRPDEIHEVKSIFPGTVMSFYK